MPPSSSSASRASSSQVSPHVTTLINLLKSSLHHADHEIINTASEMINSEVNGDASRVPLDEKTVSSFCGCLLTRDKIRLKEDDLKAMITIRSTIKNTYVITGKQLRTRGERALTILQSLNTLVLQQPLKYGVIEPLKIAIAPSKGTLFRPADAMIVLGTLVNHERVLEMYFGPQVRKLLKNNGSAVPPSENRFENLKIDREHAWWYLLKKNSSQQLSSEPDAPVPPLTVKNLFLQDAKTFYEDLSPVRLFINNSTQEFKRIFASVASKADLKDAMIQASRAMDGSNRLYTKMEDKEAEMAKFKRDVFNNMNNGGLAELFNWRHKSELFKKIRGKIDAKEEDCSLDEAFDFTVSPYAEDDHSVVGNLNRGDFLDFYATGVDVMKKLEDGKDEDIADLFPDYDSLRFVLRLLMCSTLSETFEALTGVCSCCFSCVTVEVVKQGCRC
jgi:hypothetical protein